MKNIDYVIKYHTDVENGNREFIIEYRCPNSFGLKVLDCETHDCEDCWNLEIEPKTSDINNAIEELVRVCNRLNYKILNFEKTNILTEQPRAKIKDVDKKQIFFIEYEDGQWNLA